ncbi:MAG: hypothetical protein WBP59_12145 [Ilumatobacteraceae bacterium]
MIVLFAALGAVIGAIPQPEKVAEQATSFSATNTSLINDGGRNTSVSISQIPLLAVAGEVPKRVAETIGYTGNSAQLASQVDVSVDFETSALTISTEQPSAERAELIANTFATELTNFLAESQDSDFIARQSAAQTRLASLEAELNELNNQVVVNPLDPVLLAQRDALAREYGLAYEQNREIEDNQGRLTITTLEEAQSTANIDRGLSAPTGRRTRAAMGLFVGAAIGTAIALLIAQLDNKIRSREQAETVMEMRARTVIPKVADTTGGIVVQPGRQDPLSDSYRTVRNIVAFAQSGLEPVDRARVTLVVSPGPGDGKTSLAANLAAAFAETGRRTVAANTDFRRPRLHEAVVGFPTPESGFHLEELDELPRKALPIDDVSAHLKLLDLSGVIGSPGDLARSTMRQLERLALDTDEIVIDTSPVGATAEVLELVPYADVIVLVARIGHTSIQVCERTISILRDIATAPILLVLTGEKGKRTSYHEYGERRTTGLRAPTLVAPSAVPDRSPQAKE